MNVIYSAISIQDVHKHVCKVACQKSSLETKFIEKEESMGQADNRLPL